MPTIQISEKLHNHITDHRMKLIIAQRNPNVTYNDALEDMIKRLEQGMIEKPPNTKTEKPINIITPKPKNKPEYKTYKQHKK